MSIKLCKLMLNFYVVIQARSFLRHAVNRPSTSLQHFERFLGGPELEKRFRNINCSVQFIGKCSKKVLLFNYISYVWLLCLGMVLRREGREVIVGN